MSSSTKKFELLPHTADLKIRVYGNNLKELFANAVIAMFQSIGPIAPGCSYQNDLLVCPKLPETRWVQINSIDLNNLLVDFLSEALYLSDANNEAYLDATVDQITEKAITATLHGIKITGFEVVEIKAVTHSELEIKQVEDSWCVDIVFDI